MPSADSQDYLWIAVGDIHDEPERFAKIPELSQADGIIVTGDLTIKGVTKPVTLKLNHYTTMAHPMLKKDAIGANASTVVKRSEFNAGKYAPHVGDDVTISIAIEAIKG